MPNEFPRIVSGYNRPVQDFKFAHLDSTHPITCLTAGYPGEYLGFGVSPYNGSWSDFYQVIAQIIIDGYQYFNNYLYWLIMNINYYTCEGAFSHVINIYGTQIMYYFALKLPFENYLQLKFSTATTGYDMQIAWYYRKAV